jgi:hypothetical protein
MKCKVHNNAKYEGLDVLAKDLFEFAHKRFGFTKAPTIVFESNMDNVGRLFAPTGHYNPQSSTVTIYVDHRHPKDILRSLAHELVHHKQNCDGHFGGAISTDPGYAQRDQHMREMEGDAYRTGNIMLFRDWEDNYKKGRKMMSENIEMVSEKKGEKGSYSKEREEFDKDLDGVPDGADEDADDPDVKEAKSAFHSCAAHVKENISGREGNPINHTLMEDGSVSHYTVEFDDEIVENIPVNELTVLEMNEHMHAAKRDDYEHDKKKRRRKHKHEQKVSDKEWYQGQLHEALLKKFNIKK